jgi:hypothetical protein
VRGGKRERERERERWGLAAGDNVIERAALGRD